MERDFMNAFEQAYFHGSESANKAVIKTFNAYMGKPQQQAENIMNLQAYSGSSDIPQVTTTGYKLNQDSPYYDNNWMMVLEQAIVDADRDYFEILNADNLITFAETPEGAEVRFFPVGADLTKVTLLLFTAGLKITDRAIRFKSYGAIAMAMKQFRDAYYVKKADVMYNVIGDAATASGQAEISYQGDSSDDQISRDIDTIDEAVATIGESVKDIVPNAINGQFILYYNDSGLGSRIERALRTTINDAENSPRSIMYNVMPIKTKALPSGFANDEALVGFKSSYNCWGENSDLMIENFDLKETLSKGQVGFSYYNAGVSLHQAFRKVNFS